MTEQKWLTSDDPVAMLADLERVSHEHRDVVEISPRRLRLFACACCLKSGTKIELVDEYERDGPPSWDGLSDHTDVEWARGEWARGWISNSPRVTQAYKADLLREVFGNPFRPLHVRTPPGWTPSRSRDWLTPQVLSLAQAAYDERLPDASLDPFRFALLADALEEAGCADGAILRHLRGEEFSAWDDRQPVPSVYNHWRPLRAPHVRGCWALDLILGKE